MHIRRRVGRYAVEQGSASENRSFCAANISYESTFNSMHFLVVFFFNLDLGNAVKVETEAMSDLQVVSSKEFPTEITQKYHFSNNNKRQWNKGSAEILHCNTLQKLHRASLHV